MLLFRVKWDFRNETLAAFACFQFDQFDSFSHEYRQDLALLRCCADGMIAPHFCHKATAITINNAQYSLRQNEQSQVSCTRWKLTRSGCATSLGCSSNQCLKCRSRSCSVRASASVIDITVLEHSLSLEPALLLNEALAAAILAGLLINYQQRPLGWSNHDLLQARLPGAHRCDRCRQPDLILF